VSSVQDWIDEMNDHGFTDTSVPRKVALLNDTLWDICSREPWPFLEKTALLNFDGVSPVPTNMPTDFGSVLSLVRTDNGGALDPQRYDVMQRKYQQTLTSPGDPVAYYFLDNTLNIYFVPGASTGLLQLEYLAKQPAVTQASVATDILIPLEHHRAVLLGALYKLYDMDDDFDIGSSFQQQYEDRILKMRNALWARQYDRPDRIYTVDDMDLQFLS
jgi:hypothetical protein